MNIDFLSRFQMKRLILNDGIDQDKHVVISISDNINEQQEMFDLLAGAYRAYDDPEAWQKFLCLDFADDEKSFNMIQADLIRIFANNHGHKKHYLIHCFAGISRSGAIAKWINEYFAADIPYLNDYAGYNRHVFDVMNASVGKSLRAYYEQLEKQDRGW